MLVFVARMSFSIFLTYCYFLCLLVCDSSIAFPEDALHTQKPASRAVAKCPTSQPAQCSSCHDGTNLLWHRESALMPPLLLYLSVGVAKQRDEVAAKLQYNTVS